jgi:hypothetical protein
MRVIGRLLMALAVVLPLTFVAAAGSAVGEGGGGPAVMKCMFWQDGMNISPGVGNTPADQVVSGHGRVYGCNKAGGGAQFTATMQMSGATCSDLSMQGEAQFEWTNGEHSTAFLSFDPQAPSGNKLQISGNITSGAFQGLIVVSQLRFTRVFQGSGAECSPSNLLTQVEFTNSRSLQLLTPNVTPTTQPAPPPTNGPPPTVPVTNEGTVPPATNVPVVVIIDHRRPVIVLHRRRRAFVVIHRTFPTGTLAFTGSSGMAAVVGFFALLIGGALALLDPQRAQGFARFGRRRPRKSLHVTLPPR